MPDYIFTCRIWWRKCSHAHTRKVIITGAINQEPTCWLLKSDLGQLRNVNTMLLLVKLRVATDVFGPLLMISHLSPLITTTAPPWNGFKNKIPTPSHNLWKMCTWLDMPNVFNNCFIESCRTQHFCTRV